LWGSIPHQGAASSKLLLVKQTHKECVMEDEMFDVQEAKWDNHQKGGYCMMNYLTDYYCGAKATVMMMDVEDPSSWDEDHEGQPVCDFHADQLLFEANCISALHVFQMTAYTKPII
jgi:hypothetical protein